MRAYPRVRVLSTSAFACLALSVLTGAALDQERTTGDTQIPKTWDEQAISTLEVPLADAAHSPVHVNADYYYRMPVRAIYKSYPIYAPGNEPPEYLDWLARQEPEIVFDAARLRTESDWIRAGELVFDAPISYVRLSSAALSDPEFYAQTGARVANDGTWPYQRYVIRTKGVIEVGLDACGLCHTRLMPDGSVVKGAQGNAPLGPIAAFNAARRPSAGARDLAPLRRTQMINFGAPWIQPDPLPPISSLDEFIATRRAILPGLSGRQGTSPRYPAQIPDLIGVKDRRYLDHTGLVRHRSIGDLMRYAAVNQDTQLLARYEDFIPAGQDFRTLPDPSTRSRYSDVQLYALALYIYSLKPPPNPNTFDPVARRGQVVFDRARCATCHTPPLYTNNKLTPVDGFTVPDSHRRAYDILAMSVGTDPGLALRTRRGTGYYKVPSLKGVWYRGPFEHNGSVATLADWFDPRRLREDYVPTGFKGYGVTMRAVKGHPFGLDLPVDDRRALIAFLKTL